LKFTLEKIDLSKIKDLYFLRGYQCDDEAYCVSAILRVNHKNELDASLLHSNKLLSVSDAKNLIKYLKNMGMKVTAEVLKTDFDRFYSKNSFKKISF